MATSLRSHLGENQSACDEIGKLGKALVRQRTHATFSMSTPITSVHLNPMA
jgi:hypothetical protein